ncbi:Amino acid transporter, transmembrane [Kalmanozyma brasiliensis GHG001]|uniref:Amino acid transporter, transmembrane n=1 Tax=Kalmanozyma brasiliensis (strain GHG001) TaxID=1365824 RepID=UPI002867CAA4|nr:Amino acid transporter, transmembrane [Kalmanozyma brasiliensis GHG001]EST05001.2 Amino acid transporter, transmembrane [Kalmanozyma brasiliensis GHG001]
MSALEQHTNEKEARTPPHVGSQDGSSNEDLERSPKGFKKDGDVRDDLVEVSSTADSDEVAAAARVKEAQEGGTIKYRTLSWQKAAILLFTEYVCLAILAFPWAFSYLGMAGGLLATLGVGLAALYTSLILWRYCLKHPHILNICDIGYQIFGKSKIAYELTALALVLNNVFIMGLHTLTGSEILNTLSNHGTCTVVFSIVIMLVSILLTLPRKLEQLTGLGIVSAISMFISIMLVLIFTGIQGPNPAVEDFDAPVFITAFAPKGTTFVSGFGAFLNIVFTWIGHIMYPTFIAEMKDPREFPKALYAVTVAEFVLFSVTGIVGYRYTGQYTTAPAVGTLRPVFKKIAFAFVLPTTIIIGVLYASVVAKYLFSRLTMGTKHYNNHTVLGWTVWVGCVTVTWVLGWVIGEAVPFFGSLLSLMSALFDCYFGYIFWAFAFFELNKGQLWVGQPWLRKVETAFQYVLILAGLFILGPGLYASVQSIIDNYATGSIKAPFTCANNAL